MIDAFSDKRSNGSSLSDLIHQVARFGEVVPSRYGDTIEILGGRLQVPSGTLIQRPGINYALGWMEMFQLLGGLYNLGQIQRVAPNADHSLFTFPMAYGPRVESQIPAILQVLWQNPNSRQAVVFVGKPEDGPSSNLPCTLTIQFLIREEPPGEGPKRRVIHAIVSMRSWDLCRGLPYDLMMFSGLLEAIGRCLAIETGNIIIQAGSTHIYLDQMEKLPKINPSRWRFTEDTPDAWIDMGPWFRGEMQGIQQGSLPRGIELYDR